MKRRTFLPLSGFVAAVILTVCVGLLSIQKPFAKLNADMVSSVELFAIPPETTMQITDRERIRELVNTLKTAVIYGRDNSGGEYAGQYVRFTLTMQNDETLAVAAYNPFLQIDGVFFKTKYGPCEALNRLGNEWLAGLR